MTLNETRAALRREIGPAEDPEFERQQAYMSVAEARQLLDALDALLPAERPGWDDYFLGIADAAAVRGECLRSQVAAVLVKDRRVIATGYNGVASGAPSCLDGICPRQQSGAPRGTLYSEAPCIATHAEVNAADDALRRGENILGATMYVNKEPCENCAVLLGRWGVRFVWRDLSKGTRG